MMLVSYLRPYHCLNRTRLAVKVTPLSKQYSSCCESDAIILLNLSCCESDSIGLTELVVP